MSSFKVRLGGNRVALPCRRRAYFNLQTRAAGNRWLSEGTVTSFPYLGEIREEENEVDRSETTTGQDTKSAGLEIYELLKS